MMRRISGVIQAAGDWYRAGDRWWLPLAAGVFFALCLPPFNHETSAVFAAFPFLSFVILVPLFFFSLEQPRTRAIRNTYLYGITASFTQFYWIANVTIAGLWVLILAALALLTLFIALLYLLQGMLFRVITKRFGVWSVVLYPAAWVLVEYGRSLGDMSFPWALVGYSLTPLLPLAQLASITGVYGLSFLIVLGNVLIFRLVRTIYRKRPLRRALVPAAALPVFLILVAAAGWFRLRRHGRFDGMIRVALIQSTMDQKNWNGKVSLDTALAITEQLVRGTASAAPDLVILPESGVYCYFERDVATKARVRDWVKAAASPMIFGSLHYEREKDNPYYNHRVYNTVFSLDTGTSDLDRYHKIKLVPFSEALPFEGAFPILSRVNLGESDFSRGSEEKLFSIRERITAAPFVCYEIIYPEFVRRRAARGANLLVNVTNDGWWGRSNGPFHHAAMARMRAIENGVSLARCANTGISLLVDPLGRIAGKTGIYQRTVMTGDIPLDTLGTFYGRFGDWVVRVSALMIVFALVRLLVMARKRDAGV